MNPLTCRVCGSSFADPRPPGTRGRKPSVCSPACHRAARLGYQRNRRAERRVLGQCIDCGGDREAIPGSDFCAEHAGRRAAVDLRSALERYNLTADALTALYMTQGGLCAICDDSESDTGQRHAIDHDHACCPSDTSCGRCVRGLLCDRCNRGIGYLRDRVDLLERASRYLLGG